MTDQLDPLLEAPPWVHEQSRSQAEAVLNTALDRGAFAVRINAERMQAVDGLFREYVREFRFPEYFGWNWPAFSECMTELSWLPATSYLTVIDEADLLLRDEPADLPTFLRHLANIGMRWAHSFGLGPEWGGGEVPFNTILVRDSP